MLYFFFFKQKTAYEMRISDWSSDVCSSDLRARRPDGASRPNADPGTAACSRTGQRRFHDPPRNAGPGRHAARPGARHDARADARWPAIQFAADGGFLIAFDRDAPAHQRLVAMLADGRRSEEHTSELQSLMRISYAVFCLTQKTYNQLNKNERH